MSTTTHAAAPLVVDDLGDESFGETNHKYGLGSPSRPVRRVAKVEGLGPEAHGTARLLAAAYNAFDKHCGDKAVELAEADLLGKLIDLCHVIIAYSNCEDANEWMEAHSRLVAAARSTLAKLKQ